MRDSYRSAFEFLDNIEQFQSIDVLSHRLAEVLSEFGVTSFSLVNFGASGNQAGPQVKFGLGPNEWAQRYIDLGYAKLDPFVPWVFQTSKAAAWSDLQPKLICQEQKRLFAEQQEFLPGDGLVIPIHDVTTAVAAFILKGRNPDFSTRARPVLRMLAYYFFELSKELKEAEVDWQPKSSPLTARQTECLLWVAQGKSDWEIGQILQISDGTVHRHVERAKARLDVATRVQAVMIAWKSGWMLV